jgi:hypothetical protein
VWAGGPVEQPGFSFGAEPGDPTVGALARDAEFLGDVGDRASVGDDPGHEQAPAVQVQSSVSVGHEDLLVGRDVRHLH